MFFKRADSGAAPPAPVQASPPAVTQKRPAAPIISEEADRAIFRVQLRYAMIAFALAVLGVVLLAIIGAKYPHSMFAKHVMENRPLFLVVSFVWIIPFLIGQVKQSDLRLQFGRKYAEQQRWGTVVAALRSFTEWGQRSFDRTGEAHYLLAQAYDRLNRKEQARKMRDFIRKHRSGGEWAKKIGSGTGPTASAVAANRAKRAATSDGSTPESGNAAAPRRIDRPAQTLGKPSRRKRF